MRRKPLSLSRPIRNAYTLIECLIVIGIMAVLLGMLLAAVQQARMAALRVESSNNLKQIVLATHNYATAHDSVPPSLDGSAGSPNPRISLFVAILPYIEQGQFAPPFGAGGPPVIKTYVSPADPTSPLTHGKLYSSYAANGFVFSSSGSSGRLPGIFSDGMSNTIAFAEHYACGCKGVSFNFYIAKKSPPASFHRATFADPGYSDFLPKTEGNPPTSTASWDSAFTFQAAPLLSDCNSGLAQTPHRSGMLIALGDGSVRALSPGVSGRTYWGAVTGAGGEVLGPDW